MTPSIGFEDSWWLLVGALAVGAGWWWRRRRGGALASPRVGVAELHAASVPSTWRVWAHWLSRGLLGLATVGALLALARPQRQFVERNQEAEGIDIVLAMDVSTSMLALDFEPDRLEASKAVAQTFLADRPFDRFGLVVFAGEAFAQSPLTLDHAMVGAMLAELQTGQLDDGTAIGMGLASAINRLRDSDAPSKVVILLTDGDNNAGEIDPRRAAELAAEFGIRVYTIGVGSNGQALSPVRGWDQSVRMQYVRVRIDEALLREVAAETGGRYFRATDNESLAAIYAEIDRLEKRPVTVNVSRRFEDLFAPLLGVALASGLLAGLLRVWVAPRVV